MSRKLWAIMALAVAGFAVSMYLLAVHWNWIGKAECLGIGGCELVNASRWAELFGIPVSLLGALTYLSFLGLGVLIWREVLDDYTRLAIFFIGVVGVAFSAYLTYIELFVLYQICPWCVISAIVITLITVLAFLEYREWQASG
jgi:uncharacterized membrane protein